jgi:hypothetical protein
MSEKADFIMAQLAVSLEPNSTALFFLYSGVFVCLVLVFELRADTLSNSTSPFV